LSFTGFVLSLPIITKQITHLGAVHF
jgi:hypothetical protein